jgi:hypothetical protein
MLPLPVGTFAMSYFWNYPAPQNKTKYAIKYAIKDYLGWTVQLYSSSPF